MSPIPDGVSGLLSGHRVLICDGAMGTLLHAAGAALDRSLPELNLSDPALVATIHESYLDAGADIIQTNTFGANRLWLGDHGFPDKVDEINRAGVRIARRVAQGRGADRAGQPILVAGSVSPAVTGLQRRRVGASERMEVLREQIQVLVADGGVDVLILETFGYLDELVEAVSVAAAVTDVPLIAQATFADDAHTLGGETPREVATVLSGLPVAMLGTNCTIGPQRMLAVAEDLIRYSAVPVSAQPNAGQPRRTGARSFEFSIDGGYFARYLGRFTDAGVTLVGGCCGTTPTHVKAAVAAVRPMPGADAGGGGQARLRVASRVGVARSEAVAVPAPAAGSLAEQFAQGSFVVGVAITPLAGSRAGEAEQVAAMLQAQGVGLLAVQPRWSARTHVDSLGTALQLQQSAGVETIATVTTWDKTIMSLQADLLGAHALGLRAVVSATGNPPVLGDYPAVDGTWEVDSVGLTRLLAGLNVGRDSNGLALSARTSFCIGARVNPGARDPEAEIARAHAKVKAGAHFLISRPVYEADSLARLAAALADTGVPLLLSVAPLRSFEEADYLANEVPGITIPDSTLETLEKAGRGTARAAGLELAADLLAKARPLVRGVLLTAPDDDPAAILPLLRVIGLRSSARDSYELQLIKGLLRHIRATAWNPSGVNRTTTRRAFLGGLAAAAGLGAAAGIGHLVTEGGSASEAGPATTRSAVPIAGGRSTRARKAVPEALLDGDRHWVARNLGGAREIEGYAGRASAAPGESFPLFVSCQPKWFTVTAYRLGWYRGDGARQVWRSTTLRGGAQRAAAVSGTTSTVATDWDPVIEVPTDGWPAGSYLLRLDADSGAQRYVPVTVRSSGTAGTVVLKNCVQTWQAYNTWGGYDLYQGPSGSYGTRSLAVSLDRPYGGNGAEMFLTYERNAIKLAEYLSGTAGLRLSYLTSMDIIADPAALAGASALVSMGHDEYWTPGERVTVTAARDAGVNIAFLGANTMFRRTRLAPTAVGDNRLVICYKTDYTQDPMYRKNPALVTADFREPPAADPESSLTGTLYEGYPADASYVVTSPSSWVFAGTGVRAGTSLPHLVGVEYDRVNPAYPVPRPIEVLSHSPLTCNGAPSYGDSAYYTVPSGAGVFNSGTMRWVEAIYGDQPHGIAGATPGVVRRATVNVLRAFADGPAARRYPARDNLAAVREYVGDPVGAPGNLQ